MKGVTYFARALALLWAGWWTVFFIAESLATQTPLDRMGIWVAIGLVFLAAALAAWRWERPGGLVLLGVGVLAALAYGMWGPRELPVAVRLLTLLVFGAPPAIAGAIFFSHRHGNASRGGNQ